MDIDRYIAIANLTIITGIKVNVQSKLLSHNMPLDLSIIILLSHQDWAHVHRPNNSSVKNVMPSLGYRYQIGL